MGDTCADQITAEFPEGVVLEMEKIYQPYLLMGKKRYVGLMYVRNARGEVAFDYMDAKGIELIRRDEDSPSPRASSRTSSVRSCMRWIQTRRLRRFVITSIASYATSYRLKCTS